jgi:hypothetical protein
VLGRELAAGLARGAGGLPGDGPQANTGQKKGGPKGAMGKVWLIFEKGF